MPDNLSLSKYDDNNPFAKILRGEEPAKIVYEDEQVVAFLDKYPEAKTHVLVVPKGQYTCFQDFTAKASEKDVGHFFKVVRRVATETCKLKDSGYRLIVNNGRDSNFSVPHFHMHILGGNNLGAQLGNSKKIVTDANQDIAIISDRCTINTKKHTTDIQSAATQPQLIKIEVSLLNSTIIAISSMWDKNIGNKLLAILFCIPCIVFLPIIVIASLCGATTEFEMSPEPTTTCQSQERSHSNLENAKSEPMQPTNVAKQQDVS